MGKRSSPGSPLFRVHELFPIPSIRAVRGPPRHPASIPRIIDDGHSHPHGDAETRSFRLYLHHPWGRPQGYGNRLW